MSFASFYCSHLHMFAQRYNKEVVVTMAATIVSDKAQASSLFPHIQSPSPLPAGTCATASFPTLPLPLGAPSQYQSFLLLLASRLYCSSLFLVP